MNPPNVFDDLESREDNEIDHVGENNALAIVPKTPEYTFNVCLDGYDLAAGENRSPLLSPFPIMISDYLSEDENEGNVQVDYEAEEFIKNFYDQLRAQSRVQLLQY
ncbi:putative homeobox protein knotted-1-like 5 [Bienertia sinuspersici]